MPAVWTTLLLTAFWGAHLLPAAGLRTILPPITARQETDELLERLGCPGCFFGYSDSDKGLAFDPANDFANYEGCEERKPIPPPASNFPLGHAAGRDGTTR
jgi:hypothetical protein